MRQYFVYILQCRDHSYYVGITNDIERRFGEHQNGTNAMAYTFSRRPVQLVFYERFDNPDKAIQFEKQLKGWSRKKKEAIIANDWYKLKELAICRNDTHYKNQSSENTRNETK